MSWICSVLVKYQIYNRYWIKLEDKMKDIRFFKEEDNGITYLVTNWRIVKGKKVYSSGKCWKFPLKKKRA